MPRLPAWASRRISQSKFIIEYEFSARQESHVGVDLFAPAGLNRIVTSMFLRRGRRERKD